MTRPEFADDAATGLFRIRRRAEQRAVHV